jgi:hypothetical protein
MVPGNYTITADLERSDASGWSAVDYDASWQDADMYLNLSDDRYLELKPGDSFELHPMRVWQAVRDVMSNYHTEPDYRLEILGAEGEPVTLDSANPNATSAENSILKIEKVGGRGRERYRITGKTQGLAVIKITYGALTYSGWQLWDIVDNENDAGAHHVYPNHRTNNGQALFYPSEPNCTAVVLVNVTPNGAADNAGVSTNIGEREFDTIYFARPQNSAVYTFAPTAESGTVSVRVHKPLHDTDVTWNEDWVDYGSKPSGANFDITLYEGRNIVEVSGGGAKKYHSIYAKPAKITITNRTRPGSEFSVGDVANIRIEGLKVPVQKLGGIYNPGIRYDAATEQYSTVLRFLYDAGGRTLGSTTGQYDIKSGMDLQYAIQAKETTLRNGRIECPHLGSRLGRHRFIGTDVSPNYAADEFPGIYSTLPDIVLTAQEAASEPDPEEEKPEPEEPITPIIPAPEEPAPAPVTPPVIDDSDEDAPAFIVRPDPENVQIDGDTGAVTVTMPKDKLEGGIAEAIALADKAGSLKPTLEIKFDTPTAGGNTAEPAKPKEITVKIPIDALQTVADSPVENVQVVSDAGEVTLDTGAIKELIERAKEAEGAEEGSAPTVDLVIVQTEEKLEQKENLLTQEQKEAIRGEKASEERKVREIFDVSLYAGVKRIEDFKTRNGGLMTIGLPYKLQDDDTPEGVGVLHVQKDGVTEPMVDGRYDVKKELAIFQTDHLSVYVVVHEKKAKPEDAGENANEDAGENAKNGGGGSGGGGCDTAGFGSAAWAIFSLGTALAVKNGKPKRGLK